MDKNLYIYDIKELCKLTKTVFNTSPKLRNYLKERDN